MARQFKILMLPLVLLFIAIGTGDAQAQWRTVPFDAGDFTGSGSMTWTVESTDIEGFRYVVNDRTMTVALVLNTSTVGGTADQVLKVKIPGGYRAGGLAFNPAFIRKDSGSPFVETGYAITNKNLDTIAIYRSNFTAQQLSTNATFIYFTITFDVCGDVPDTCP